MLHIPRYISSSRLSNFFIPFKKPDTDEVFDIKRSSASLCVFSGERLKSAQNSTFFETPSERLTREGWCDEKTKGGKKLCNLTKTALFICF